MINDWWLTYSLFYIRWKVDDNKIQNLPEMKKNKEKLVHSVTKYIQ